MASGEEHLTGVRWFIHDTVETARDAVRLYFAPLVWIRNFFRGMAVLADRGKEQSTVGDVPNSPSIIVSDEEFEDILMANRRTEQTLRDLMAEHLRDLMAVDDAEPLKRRLVEPLRDLQREREALLRMQRQLKRFQMLRIRDLLHQRMSDSPDRPISPPAHELQPDEE